jgi:hypothetical protein
MSMCVSPKIRFAVEPINPVHPRSFTVNAFAVLNFGAGAQLPGTAA